MRECRGGYAVRTRRNVHDSDGTVIVFFEGRIQGGTATTVEAALRLRRPLLLVDATVLSPRKAAWRVANWVRTHGIRKLNVAGPRESQFPGAARYARALVLALAKYYHS